MTGTVRCSQGAIQKRRECEKLAADGKMETSQLPDIARRTDVISYALLAEINHFHSERAVDFKVAMQQYLQEQIVFYQKVCKLCSATQTGAFVLVLARYFRLFSWGRLPDHTKSYFCLFTGST
jgi:hypothetical protein